MRKFFIIGIIIIGFFSLSGMEILAEENGIKSKGKIEGIVNFYSEDIIYLKSEIDSLLAECLED